MCIQHDAITATVDSHLGDKALGVRCREMLELGLWLVVLGLKLRLWVNKVGLW